MPPHIIDIWDSGLPGAQWDSGLQWDVNVGPSAGDIVPWLDLIASQHKDKPKYMAMLAVLLQPLADIKALLASMPALFDVDVAVGDQLDIVGEWVGVTRSIAVPLSTVYFSFDIAGLGFDEGTWFSSFNPVSGVIKLSDEAYRTLLRARIANNQWDGSIPNAYEIWNAAFSGTGVGILIQDLETMHMLYALTGPVPDAVTLALFKGGYLNLKPAGVRIDAFVTPTLPGTPYFGFDVESASIAGFDTGAFGAIST